jgi:hypothetical protein
MSIPDREKDTYQNEPVYKSGDFAYSNNRIALIYFNTFFTDVYSKVFSQFELKVRCYKEIDNESISDIKEFDPLVIVVIDDYLGQQIDYAKEIAFKIKNSEKTKTIPIVLTSDRPPSQVAEDIIKIYALSQNQT